MKKPQRYCRRSRWDLSTSCWSRCHCDFWQRHKQQIRPSSSKRRSHQRGFLQPSVCYVNEADRRRKSEHCIRVQQCPRYNAGYPSRCYTGKQASLLGRRSSLIPGCARVWSLWGHCGSLHPKRGRAKVQRTYRCCTTSRPQSFTREEIGRGRMCLTFFCRCLCGREISSQMEYYIRQSTYSIH